MVELDVPYFSQVDNWYNPTGACNVTSMAMVMSFYGIKARGGMQLEDELYKYVERKGMSRHSPYDLACCFESFTEVDGNPCYDDFHVFATAGKIKSHLDGGNPVVTHGYFTAFGHIIVIVGYDDRGNFICHDPYGEWYDRGYDINNAANQEKGKYIKYRVQLLERLCAPDGQWWCHFFRSSKPNPYTALSSTKKEELSGLRLGDVLDLNLDFDFQIGSSIDSSLVLNVQIALELHLNISPGGRDGVIGPKTVAAYRQAMTSHQCRPDRLGEREAKLLIQGKL